MRHRNDIIARRQSPLVIKSFNQRIPVSADVWDSMAVRKSRQPCPPPRTMVRTALIQTTGTFIKVMCFSQQRTQSQSQFAPLCRPPLSRRSAVGSPSPVQCPSQRPTLHTPVYLSVGPGRSGQVRSGPVGSAGRCRTHRQTDRQTGRRHTRHTFERAAGERTAPPAGRAGAKLLAPTRPSPAFQHQISSPAPAPRHIHARARVHVRPVRPCWQPTSIDYSHTHTDGNAKISPYL